MERYRLAEPLPGEAAAAFHRRRRIILPLFFVSLLVGVAFVAVGIAYWDAAFLSLPGYAWLTLGCLVIAGGALAVGLGGKCPGCGARVAIALLQGHEAEICPRCGVELT